MMLNTRPLVIVDQRNGLRQERCVTKLHAEAHKTHALAQHLPPLAEASSWCAPKVGVIIKVRQPGACPRSGPGGARRAFELFSRVSQALSTLCGHACRLAHSRLRAPGCHTAV
jgi:hypothetical protein